MYIRNGYNSGFGEEYSRPCWSYWSADDRRNCRDEEAGVATTQADIERAEQIGRDTQAMIARDAAQRRAAAAEEELARVRAETEARIAAASVAFQAKRKKQLILAIILLSAIGGGVYYFKFKK